MHGPQAGTAESGLRGCTGSAGTAHERLAGTNGSAIERLPGRGRRTAGSSGAGSGGRGRRRTGLRLLLETLD